MTETTEMATLFEALKLLRRSRLDEPLGELSNGALYRIAQLRPESEESLPDDFGLGSLDYGARGDIVSLVKLFSPGRTHESANAVARRKIEEIEVSLYRLLIGHLKSRYGENWWFSGVPESIRVKASQLYEESEGQIEKETALYLRDLKEVALSEWGEVKDQVASPQESKRGFASRVDRLLELRNRLSHPIRLKDNPLSEEELEALDEWLEVLEDYVSRESEARRAR
ncbi:hypothetical protein [Pelagicoccus sp. SDUM812002]|uniref:hypothetical protein n=1 Tax=Pelagicoccus sp. SDUM812002 TaxID=3041266 RepID=UPI00280CEABF|nr:hypothetical protein [Pelagicoccus sp. SDUM812002]MDQ8187605.1 hypothetical protein [Pelagicoccus sp. SDUM812002]